MKITREYKTKQDLFTALFKYPDGSGKIDTKLLIDVLFSLQEQIDELREKPMLEALQKIGTRG